MPLVKDTYENTILILSHLLKHLSKDKLVKDTETSIINGYCRFEPKFS